MDFFKSKSEQNDDATRRDMNTASLFFGAFSALGFNHWQTKRHTASLSKKTQNPLFDLIAQFPFLRTSFPIIGISGIDS